MDILERVFGFVRPGLPLVATLIFGTLALYGIRLFLDRRYEGHADQNMKMQLSMLVLSFVLLIVAILVAPLSDNRTGQLLSLIGIVLSAAIALSSTTFVGNAMAGLMMRAVKGFRVGDFVRVGEHFGRVSERGLFHIEIQTEERDLTTLPNLHLVTNPVKVVRSSGTIVWAEVSLGYDVPRTQVKEALLRAAEKCELQEPFVHVMQLGDFSVVYRVAGLLPEVKQLLSTRSRIRECALDELHTAGIEIVSPNFMNTRQIGPELKIIPRVVRDAKPVKGEPAPEDIVFDKADEAESMEQIRAHIETLGNEIKTLKESLNETEDEKARAATTSRIERLERSRATIKAGLDAATEESRNGLGK